MDTSCFTMRGLRRPALAIAASGLLLTLSACGGSSGEADDKVDSSSDSLSGLAAKLPQKIIDAGKIKDAVMVPAPPFEFEDDNGDLVGIDIELADALEKVIGFPIDVDVITDFAQLVPGVQSGRYDMVLSGVWDTDERQKIVNMVDYLQTGMGIVTATDSEITSLDDLCGKKVVTGAGTAYVEQLGNLAEEKCGDKDAIKVVAMQGAFADYSTQLDTGRVDAIADGFDFAGYQLTQNYADTRHMINDEPLYPALYAMVVNKDLDGLDAVMQEAMQTLVDDGTYGKILEKWGQTGGALDTITVNGGGA